MRKFYQKQPRPEYHFVRDECTVTVDNLNIRYRVKKIYKVLAFHRCIFRDDPIMGPPTGSSFKIFFRLNYNIWISA